MTFVNSEGYYVCDNCEKVTDTLYLQKNVPADYLCWECYQYFFLRLDSYLVYKSPASEKSLVKPGDIIKLHELGKPTYIVVRNLNRGQTYVEKKYELVSLDSYEVPQEYSMAMNKFKKGQFEIIGGKQND